MRKIIFLGFICFMLTAMTTAVYAMGNMPPKQEPRDYCETENPIMLVPGASGFNTLIGFVDYWWQIPKNLERDGAVVRASSLSALIDPRTRGEQLIPQIEDFLAETGKEKVHLIGHSLGTVTSRYVASVRPDLVASVTCIAGPHRYMALGGLIDDLTPMQKRFLYFGMDLFGEMFNVLGNKNWPQDSEAMFEAFTMEGIDQFNIDYPGGVPATNEALEGKHFAWVPEYDESGEVIKEHLIRYYSWMGNARRGTNFFDFTDLAFHASGILLESAWTPEYEAMAGPVAHDALVPVWSSRFGQVIREDYYWNHLDESNMMFGIISPFASNPVAVFRQHANRLKKDE